MRSSALLLAVALVACAVPVAQVAQAPMVEQAAATPCPTPGPYAFYPPVGFPEARKPDVERARVAWNAILRADHQIEWSELGHNRILWYRPSVPGYTGQHIAAGVVFIDPDVPDVYEHALHELGHHVGIGHIAVVGAVMCGGEITPSVDCGKVRPTALTPDDRAACVRVGACDP